MLQQVQDQPRQAQHPKIFIRPRHIAMAEELAQWQELIMVDGMVLPEFCLNQLRQWQQILPDFIQVMPTLEDAETFDMGAMRELRQALQQDFRQVLVLRIGGNDLLNCLAVRRPRFDPVSNAYWGINCNLAGQFYLMALHWSAPVCEHFTQVKLLQDELYLIYNMVYLENHYSPCTDCDCASGLSSQ